MTVYNLNPILGNHILGGTYLNNAYDGFATPSIGEDATKRRALLKYSLPVGKYATVEQTIMAQSNTASQTYTLYRLLRNITNTATWVKYDGSNNWATAGGLGTGDIDPVALGSVTASVTAGNRITIPLNAAEVQKMATGVYNNYGFIIVGSSSTILTYYNYNYATVENRPILYISTSEAGGRPVTMLSDYGIL